METKLVIGDIVKAGEDLGIVTFSYSKETATVYFPLKRKEAVLKFTDLTFVDYSAARKHFGDNF